MKPKIQAIHVEARTFNSPSNPGWVVSFSRWSGWDSDNNTHTDYSNSYTVSATPSTVKRALAAQQVLVEKYGKK